MRYGAVVTVAEIYSQMGEFKPMLPIGKETMIQRVVRTLRKADVEDVVVITGYRHEVIEENLNDAGVMFLKNERFIQGDWIDSVKMGMEWLDDKCDKILAIPGDIHMVMENTIRELLAKEGEFAYPTFQGEPGYPIVLGSQAAAGLTNAISTEEYQAKPNAIEHLLEITKGLGIQDTKLAVEDVGVTLQINSQKDYEKALKLYLDEAGRNDQVRVITKTMLATDEKFFGNGTEQLLELIGVTGSVNTACQAMQMSYTKAWKMINRIEKKLGYRVMERVAGGREGGGSQLTEEGERLLRAYQKMRAEVQAAAEISFQKYVSGILG